MKNQSKYILLFYQLQVIKEKDIHIFDWQTLNCIIDNQP